VLIIFQFAIKEIQIPHGDVKTGASQAWEHEAKALAKTNTINHDHILKCVAAIRRGDKRYFVFPWADGDSLREYWNSIPKQNPNAELVLRAIQQIRGLADALDRLHNYTEPERARRENDPNVTESASSVPSVQVLDENDETMQPLEAPAFSSIRHGDLKPENILRFTTAESVLGTLKIADMGLAKQHVLATQHRKHLTSTRYGTVQYEPPEALDKRARSRLYDVWSMGCIALEFIIWLLHGNNALLTFYEQLTDTAQQTCRYYKLTDRQGANIAEIHPVVSQWIDNIKANDPECSKNSAINDLIDLVRDKLLVVSLPPSRMSSLSSHRLLPPPELGHHMTRYRATAAEFRESLDRILEKAIDPGYLHIEADRSDVHVPNSPSKLLGSKLETAMSSKKPTSTYRKSDRQYNEHEFEFSAMSARVPPEIEPQHKSYQTPRSYLSHVPFRSRPRSLLNSVQSPVLARSELHVISSNVSASAIDDITGHIVSTALRQPSTTLEEQIAPDTGSAVVTQDFREVYTLPSSLSNDQLALQEQISRALQRTTSLDGVETEFLPYGDLSRLMNFSSVYHELVTKSVGQMNTSQLKQIAESICSDTTVVRNGVSLKRTFRKIFAILVLLNMTSMIPMLLDEDVSDLDLPLSPLGSPRITGFVRKHPTKKDSYVELESFQHPQWSSVQLRNLHECQWKLLAPFLSKSDAEGVKHYTLRDQEILPFITSDDGKDTTRTGGFATVSMVSIHKDHHNFETQRSYASGFAVKQQLREDDRESFLNEINVLRGFSGLHEHDHISPLLATFEQAGKLHMIFYRATGDMNELWQEIARRPIFDHRNVLWMAGQCAGLAQGLLSIHQYVPNRRQYKRLGAESNIGKQENFSYDTTSNL
jgi:serine/threonine protein kinase